MKKNTYKKLIIRQRLFGILILILSIIVILLAHTGIAIDERDCSPILLLVPLGIYLVFTKHLIIY